MILIYRMLNIINYFHSFMWLYRYEDTFLFWVFFAIHLNPGMFLGISFLFIV